MTPPDEPWWIALIKALAHHQPRHGRVRVHDLARAQGCSAACSSATARTAPARSGCCSRSPTCQARPQGGFFPARARSTLPYIAAPVARVRSPRSLAFAVIPFGPGWTVDGYHINGVGRERPDLADPDLRARLDRHLRLHRRRLGVATRSTRCSARCARARSSSRTRSRSRSSVLGVVIMGRLAEPRRDRRPAGGDARGSSSRSSSASSSSCIAGIAETNAAAVRPARGRHRARRRLPHRVLRHALGPVPDGRVHQHDRALGARA